MVIGHLCVVRSLTTILWCSCTSLSSKSAAMSVSTIIGVSKVEHSTSYVKLKGGHLQVYRELGLYNLTKRSLYVPAYGKRTAK